MRIPEEKISEILNISDIVQVVSESVILKKAGINYFGLCPFHSEKTPSFSVNPQKQIFHCFGCSAGGNVLSFVMKYHGISFPEAARMLARKYGVQIETGPVSPARKKEISLKENLFRLNKQVMTFFSENLKSAPEARSARQYLTGRGTSQATIDLFAIGYAPDRWDSVATLFRQMKVSGRLAASSGLVLPRKQASGSYDRFRNRIIFPIFDINMQVAGFGGRVMDDALPKYLNSPETPVYSKGRILYGLHQAKTHCRQADRVYIVEGYFDFLSLYQHGIKNTVASLGTALTSDHVRILKGFASKMVLVFDSDAAGISAAKRSIATFVKEGVDVRILVLPDGDDPDSFVTKYGGEAFENKARQALSAMDFLTETAVRKYGLSIEGRLGILNDMKSHLALIRDSAVRSLYIRELAEKINIDENAVLEKVREAAAGQGNTRSELLKAADGSPRPLSHAREEQIVALMLQYPQINEQIEKENVLSYFYSEKLKQIGRMILDAGETQGSAASRLMAGLPGEDQELIASLAMQDVILETRLNEKVSDLISRIIRVRKKEENTLTNKIIHAEKGCDSELFDLLAKKQQEIQKLHFNKTN